MDPLRQAASPLRRCRCGGAGRRRHRLAKLALSCAELGARSPAARYNAVYYPAHAADAPLGNLPTAFHR